MKIIKGAMLIVTKSRFPKESVAPAKITILQLFTRTNAKIITGKSTDIAKEF